MSKRRKGLNEKDFESKFWRLNDFLDIPNRLRFLIDRGLLAQFYCIILFNHRLNPKFKTKSPDLFSRYGRKMSYEVKYRYSKITELKNIIKGDISPKPVSIRLCGINYVYYVYLNNQTLVPLCIFKIHKDKLTNTKGRKPNSKMKIPISFVKAFKNKPKEIEKYIVYRDTKFFELHFK